MNCRDWLEHRALRNKIELYFDAEADPALAERVRRHLRICWPCSEEAEFLLLMKSALRHLEPLRCDELTMARLHRFLRSLAANHKGLGPRSTHQHAPTP